MATHLKRVISSIVKDTGLKRVKYNVCEIYSIIVTKPPTAKLKRSQSRTNKAPKTDITVYAFGTLNTFAIAGTCVFLSVCLWLAIEVTRYT